MGLSKYRSKRNFKSTPEPKGNVRRSNTSLPVFVVQEHSATNLHYDFRLELDGVLKSWAVPKGPSMNPEDKRLAVMVEDHPYDYKDFEGTIEEGYGAGTVIVWDNGTYEAADSANKEDTEKSVRSGLRKGHVDFILHGKKLKGRFSLIRLNSGQKKNWLLVKNRDRYAMEKDILKKQKSVLTGKTLPKKKRKSSPKKTIK